MQIKGLILRSRIQFVKKNFGENAWEKVLNALSPEDRKTLEEKIFVGSWYPFDIGKNLDGAIQDNTQVIDIKGKTTRVSVQELVVGAADTRLSER